MDVRILSATHKPLEPAGKFRSDLYFRLNVIEIPMPGLKERTEDIPILDHFLTEISQPVERRRVTVISAEAMELLSDYTGNVRNTINILQRQSPCATAK